MWRTLLALGLIVTLPASGFAGPLREAAARAGRDLAVAQQAQAERSRARFWTSLALIAGGGTLAVLGGVELREDENGADADDEPGMEDSSGWEKAMLGGGIAAAALGGVLLVTGRKGSGPSVSVRGGRMAVTHTVRF